MDSTIIANQVYLYATIIAITAPFLSFFLSLIFKKIAPVFAIVSISISLLASSFLFINLWHQPFTQFSFNWLQLGNYNINIGILLNDLSLIMLVLISFIALLVHIYSVEYIRKEALKYRYFAYLSLFCFAMLCVVIADNLLILYAFWELVGFASYLLIGFWFTKEKAVAANKKAFIMNRIGDVGFLIGLMILLAQFHTLDINTLFGTDGLINSSFINDGVWVTPFTTMPGYWLSIAGICFLAGATAKSAQFPLHTWLPDAMQGPTAVSSLIHAATMVAAGVFLLIRVSPLFSDLVLLIMAIIGLLTAFMAATIALTQTDIKKVLAFSTISQLGFMVLAVGVGANGAAIFHLVTHAFFKCLLFLGAGMVIHQIHHLKEHHHADFDEQDMRNMGGLYKFMPLTAVVFMIAAIALSGLPFSSGYLSKDTILIGVFEWASLKGGIYWLFPLVLSITSWLTTFYIFRVVFKTFFGDFNLAKALKIHANEVHLTDPNNWMKIPVVILAAFCLAFFFSINPFNPEGSWLFATFALGNHHTESIFPLLVPIYINILSFILIYAAYQIYAKKKVVFSNQETWYYKFSYNQWYFNKIYDEQFVNIVILKANLFYWVDKKLVNGFIHLVTDIVLLISKIVDWLDRNVVDGFVNATATLVTRIGIWFRAMHNGKVQHYFIWMFLLFLSFIIYRIII